MTIAKSKSAPAGDVSVVIPTFEDGHLLEMCLSSVARQTLQAAEIIVVDDGSSNPEALVGLDSAIANCPRARLVRQPHGGPAAARNRGIAECHGRFVVFVDADDQLRPDNLALKRSMFGRAHNVVATFGGFSAIGPNGVECSSGFRDYLEELDPRLIGIAGGVPGGLPLYMFRTDALKAIGGLDMSLRIMEDFDAIIRLGRNSGGLFAGCNEPIYFRNLRPNSLSRGSSASVFKGTVQFLAKARKERYFSRPELARRYLRAIVDRILSGP